MLVTGGSTNVTTYFQMRLLAGGDATALTITDFDLSYTRSGATTAAKADATDLGSANAAHSDNGGYEVDPTDCPGLHRFDWPDAAFAAGVREVILTVKHTSCFTESLRVEIDGEVSVTEWNGVKLATTNPLPNAAPDAAGGLPISDAGGLDLDAKLAATNEVTAARMGALTDWIDGGRLDLILDIIAADVVNLDGAAMRGTDNAALAATALSTAIWTVARAGYLDNINNAALATTAAQTGDSYARLGAPAGASVSADIASVQSDTTTLLARITSTLFTGITSVAEWLGALAGKQTGDATARTEIRATGAGSGTYDETTDSQEALRDRGDAAWVTAVGFSTHTASAVTADMDANSTQLAAIVADTNELQTDWADGGRLDLLLDIVVAATQSTGEPGQGSPPATADRGIKLDYLYKWARNKLEQTATTRRHYNDAGDTVDQQATISDDGTTFTKGEIVTGP